MELLMLLEIAQSYANLGDAIREQLDDVVADPYPETVAEQNPNALEIARDEFLKPLRELLKDEDGDMARDLCADIDEVVDAIDEALVDPRLRTTA